jgi:hypothetical protein
MEHALPRRTAGIPRTWSLCMTSENHGTVGPAGCTFSHAPDKHERVLVVEAPAGAHAPAAEFKGYVDGQPAVTWFDRDNMPRVGTKLFVGTVAVQARLVAAPEEALRVVRRLLDGSQPKDLAGAIMVIDSALNGGAAWTYEIEPPAGFADYVQANYSGDVSFHDPAWHARRLWNAAMRNFSKSSSGSPQASTSGERQEGGSRG